MLDGTSVLRHPLAGLAGGDFRDKQILVGWTRDEARMWYALGIMKPPSDRFRVLATIRRFHPDTAELVLEQLGQSIGAADLARLEEVFLSEAIYKAPGSLAMTFPK